MSSRELQESHGGHLRSQRYHSDPARPFRLITGVTMSNNIPSQYAIKKLLVLPPQHNDDVNESTLPRCGRSFIHSFISLYKSKMLLTH